MIDFKKLCDDFNIPYTKSGKHKRAGWVNISCPICSGHSGFHGGINLKNAYYNCHRCGSHYLPQIIGLLTNTNLYAANNIIKKYSTGTITSTQKEKRKVPQNINFPSNTSLTQKAKKYLISRKYNPDKLAQQWGLLSTSNYGFYKYRILAPIYQNQQLVSYQCRDITEKHPQKYLACFQEEEIIQHQHCIYGLDQAIRLQKKQCIVVEGITDVWRLGPGAVATFGISFTKQQTQLIAKNFNRVFILFDGESQAQAQADEFGFLVSSAFGNCVEIINLPFIVPDIDPGDLSQDDADDLMKEINLK